MIVSPSFRPTATPAPRSEPASRARAWGAAAILASSLAVLSGCYQVPEWADPTKLAGQLYEEFEHPANLMERYLFEGKVPGADGSFEKKTADAAAPPETKPAEAVSEPPKQAATAPAPVPMAAMETPPDPVASTPPVAASPEREVLRGLIDATDEGHDKPTAVADVAARGDAPMSLKPAEEPAPDARGGAGEIAVHLASYRHIRNLLGDWKRMVRLHPEFLLGLKARVATVDLGPEKGTFHRLIAGPLPDRKFAARLCKSLRGRGVYCAIMPFDGRRLAAVEREHRR